MFTQNTFRFLDELAANNNKTWFEANKKNYELLVREPAFDFIEAMAPTRRASQTGRLADAGVSRHPFLARQNTV
jgi:uncharacterized protein (DUF2461 family)